MTRVSHRRFRWLMLATIAGFAALGCIPKRIFWSPDGQRAVVATKSEVYIADGEGHLSEPWKEVILQAAWFHDSRRVAVLRKQTVRTWDEIRTCLSEERQAELLAMADSLRAEILAYKGDWKEWRPTPLMTRQISLGELVALGFYIREHRKEGLEEKLGANWKEWAETTYDISLLQVCEVSEDGVRPGPVIVQSVEDIGPGISVAPNDRYVSFVATRLGDVGDLLVCEPVEGASPKRIAECVASFPAWSPDGRALAFGRTSPPALGAENEVRLGSISRRQVCGEDGRLLAEFGPVEDLAGILFTPHTKVHCLADGRLLFSAAEAHLPCTNKDMPTTTSLFAVDPQRQPTLTRLITREAERTLPADGFSLGLFEVSPDGSRVTVADWDNGGLFVYTLATGEVKEVLPVSTEKAELPGVPSWRSDRELCITVPPGGKWGSEKRAEVLLWSPANDEAKAISREWPDQMVADLVAK